MSVGRLRKGGLVLVFALAVGALAAGCQNPFTPATPQAPSGTPVVENWTLPDSVLRTMADALMNHSASGRNAYYNALADSTSPAMPEFYAFAYPTVADLFPTAPTVWDSKLEKLFYDNLINVYGTYTYSFKWSEDLSQVADEGADGSGTTALLHRTYQLQAISPDGNDVRIVTIGAADLSFAKVEGRWYLIRWQDRLSKDWPVPSDSDHPSMGWRRLNSS